MRKYSSSSLQITTKFDRRKLITLSSHLRLQHVTVTTASRWADWMWIGLVFAICTFCAVLHAAADSSSHSAHLYSGHYLCRRLCLPLSDIRRTLMSVRRRFPAAFYSCESVDDSVVMTSRWRHDRRTLRTDAGRRKLEEKCQDEMALIYAQICSVWQRIMPIVRSCWVCNMWQFRHYLFVSFLFFIYCVYSFLVCFQRTWWINLTISIDRFTTNTLCSWAELNRCKATTTISIIASIITVIVITSNVKV